MKKILCTIIAGIFLMCPFTVFAENTFEKLFFEGFENTIQFQTYQRGNLIKKETETDDSYLKMKVNTETCEKSGETFLGPYIDKIFSTAFSGDEIFIEADINFSNCTKTQLVFSVRDSLGNNLSLFYISNGKIYANSGAKKDIKENTVYEVSVKLDFKNNKYCIAVDGIDYFSDEDLSGLVNADIKRMRVQFLNISEGCNAEIKLDNILIYKSREKIKEWKKIYIETQMIESVMKKYSMFYTGARHAWINGEIKNIEWPSFIKDGVMYISAEDLANIFSGSYTYKDGKYYLDCSGDRYIFEENSIEFIYNDKKIQMKNFPQKGETLYIPDEAATVIFGGKYISDSSGFTAFFNDDGSFFDWENGDLLFEAISDIIFEKITGQEIIKIINENGLQHNLYLNNDEFEGLKNLIKINSEAGKWYEQIKKSADDILTQPPVVYGLDDNIRMLSRISKMRQRIETCAFVYKISDDKVYAERAYAELEALTADEWPDWNPYHMLGVGEAMSACAVGYDWLQDYLTDSQKSAVREAVREKGWKHYLNDFKGLTHSNNAAGRENGASVPYQSEEEELLRSSLWTEFNNNWNFVIDGGVISSVLAFGNEDDSAAEACEVFDYALTDVMNNIKGFAPDGVWFEGVGYRNYSMEFLVAICKNLSVATGTDYGVSDFMPIGKNGEYAMSVNGYGGVFNYSDSSDRQTIFISENFWLAKRYNNNELYLYTKNYFNENPEKVDVFTLIYGAPLLSGNVLLGEEKHAYNNRDVSALKYENNKNYFAIHAGKNDVAHSHIDTGTFVMDAFGKRFACDLGSENYNISGGFYQYRKNAQGHNLVVFNPTDDGYGQKYNAGGKCIAFSENSSGGFAAVDLTDVYADYVSSYKRGIKLNNETNEFIVQDEIVGKDNIREFYWFMHTEANIDVAEDGKSAVLTLGDISLKAEILSDISGKFEIMECKGIENSKVSEYDGQSGQYSLETYKKLAIHIENVKDAVICVGFMPNNASNDFSAVHDIEEWTAPDEKYSNIVAEDILIDSTAIEGFDSSLYEYHIMVSDRKVPEIEVITANECEIVYPDFLPGTAYVYIHNGSRESIYTINFTVSNFISDGLYRNKIPIKSCINIAQNNLPMIIDNQTETFEKLNSPEEIILNTGNMFNISHIDIISDADWAEISISEDGECWNKIFEGSVVNAVNGFNLSGRFIKLYFEKDAFGECVKIYDISVFSEEKSYGTADFIVAVYSKNENRLVKVEKISKEIVLGEIVDFNEEVENNSDYIVKAFLWNNGLVPCALPVIIN